MLEGVRVVECAAFLVGPRVTAHLADLGADVIKIEHPQGGDPMRNVSFRGALPPLTEINYIIELENRGKRSITLDLNSEAGQEVAHRLVKEADVFLSNFQAHVLRRLKIDYATLSAINPRLIYAMVSGWGMRGPDKDRPGFDYSVFAESGLMDAFGEPDTPPVTCRPGFGDHITSLATVYGVMAALYHREKSGKGQMVHASILGSLIDAGALALQGHLSTGQAAGRVSQKDMSNPLWNFYGTKDGRYIQFAMAQSDRHWADFCQALEMQEYQNDPRFRDAYARDENRHQLIEIIDGIMASRSQDEWLGCFQGKNIICAAVASYPELAQNPQVWENNYVIEVEHQSRGRIPMVGLPVDFSATPGKVRGGAPELGQHTEEVLLELGYSWDAIGTLKDRGVIL
ncbi:MAG: CaiB/BaiF CoA transferase family protein [Dehalococcoidia bacterium]